MSWQKVFFKGGQYIPEGISSSIRDFIVLAFNFQVVFHIKYSEK